MNKTIVKILALSLIAVMMCLALVSCGGPNADPDKAEEALKKADYTVVKADDDISLALYEAAGVKGLECVITAFNEDEEGIVILYFEDKDAANEAWEEVEKDAKEEMEDEEDVVIKKSGKMIYYGTKEAVKAAK